jgi:hypothetical protein
LEYVENVAIWKLERILTNSFFKKIEELMKLKKENYYPIVNILTSIAYRHSLSPYMAEKLYTPMEGCGIVKILEDDCERLLKSEVIGDEEVRKKKDTIILLYSLTMWNQWIESSLLKRITEYLIKMISNCVVDSSLLNVGMKTVVSLELLRFGLFLSLSFSYSIFSCSFYS